MKKHYNLIPLNFKEFNGNKLVVNILGEFAFVSDKSLRRLIGGKEKVGGVLDKFSFDSDSKLNATITKYRYNKRFLKKGTSLFIFVLTRRCNLSCVYCQASRVDSKRNDTNMSLGTADLALDLVFRSPQNNITIEFQGGEPLMNYNVFRYIVEKARVMEKETNKKINLNLVTNLTLLSNDKLKFILENDVSLCTSLDGSKNVHDKNRPYSRGSSYDKVVEKIRFIKNKTKNIKGKFLINAIQTTTKISLGYPNQIIDTYKELDLHSIYIRPLNKFGFADKIYKHIGYSPYEFLEFYKKCLDHIIELNLNGFDLIERTSQVFLNKIYSYNTIRNMDLMSPCGAGIGQIAINFDGNVYTCDEGRMVADMGDESFKLGSLKDMLFMDLHNNDVTKLMCVASCTEGTSRCRQCPYLPYCGLCPIINYTEEGSIFKNSPRKCIINEGILDILFDFISKNDKKTIELFKRWAECI